MAGETKLIAYARCGGQASLRQLAESDHISSGAKNLSQLEMEQYTRARLMAAPANGGTLAQAKEYLETEGWTCYWDGAPPKLDTRFELRLTAEEKGWVLEHGGADMVRTLIRAARERQEATDAPAGLRGQKGSRRWKTYALLAPAMSTCGPPPPRNLS